MSRVVEVGQWLGTENWIVRMQWSRRNGWVATDVTGARYRQRGEWPPCSPPCVLHADGLPTADEQTDGTILGRGPLTPWPSSSAWPPVTGDEEC